MTTREYIVKLYERFPSSKPFYSELLRVVDELYPGYLDTEPSHNVAVYRESVLKQLLNCKDIHEAANTVNNLTRIEWN